MSEELHETHVESAGDTYWFVCTCGASGAKLFTDEKVASRSGRDHCKGRANAAAHEAKRALRALVAESDAADVTPRQVVCALQRIIGPRYDLAAIAWERGATGIVVFQGEGGSAAIRYVLSPDLQEVIVTERCRAKGWR